MSFYSAHPLGVNVLLFGFGTYYIYLTIIVKFPTIIVLMPRVAEKGVDKSKVPADAGQTGTEKQKTKRTAR
jgi:hypothetical protein